MRRTIVHIPPERQGPGLALESERVRVMEVAISDAHRIPALIEDFAQTIRRIGPNPMKGFE